MTRSRTRRQPYSKVISGVSLLVLVASSVTVVAWAGSPRSEARLNATEQIVRWSGSSSGGPPFVPVVQTPETCAAAAVDGLCDSFALDVDLPAGTYTKAGDGLFVAIRWATDFLQWNLFVYGPDGALAASASDVDSNAQAIVIPHAANGRYTILAAPASPEAMTYTGEARVLLDRTARSAPDTVLAPQLSTVPPFDFHVACAERDPQATPTNGRCADVAPIPSNPSGWRWGGSWNNSCYADETSGSLGVARRCLRFSNDIRNVGTGPFVLRAQFVDGLTPGRCRMSQVIMHADGNEEARDAGACEFHTAHGHFHYLNTSQYSLVSAPDDTTTPPNLTRTPVAQTRKLGYCLVDIDLWANADEPSELAPRRWSYPTCDVPSGSATKTVTSPVQEMGISTGWGDIYTWDLPGQYLDVTEVPDGVYDVVSVANPDCSIEESAIGLEGAATRIRLEGATVRVVATFGPFPVPGCSVPVTPEPTR